MLNGELYSPSAVDMWSSGVILFALVCGYLPFEDENTSDLYRRIINADYSIPNFVSSDVVDLIRKILVPDPKKRLTLMEIVSHE
jgi:5'-AMP-activated protein kinase catalytic alpha subunit